MRSAPARNLIRTRQIQHHPHPTLPLKGRARARSDSGDGVEVIRIPILHAGMREPFPPVETAFDEPNGLLAAGGDLSPERLLEAYRHGIFPWFSEGEPILWWSPDPRMVFATAEVHVSTRLQRWLRHCDWTIRADTMFADVMRACAA